MEASPIYKLFNNTLRNIKKSIDLKLTLPCKMNLLIQFNNMEELISLILEIINLDDNVSGGKVWKGVS